MATYLITGAAGFIGSNLASHLLARGHRVLGIDNFATGRHENLTGLEAMDVTEGDINNRALLDPLVKEADYILHQAAIPSVPRSVADPMASHHAGATGALNVLDAARLHGKVKRVVVASSSSAYGNTEILPKVETMPVSPLSPYAVAKLATEHYALAFHQVYGLPTCALRYFNIFGPRQDPASTYAAVIPKFILSMRRAERPPVFGDGKQTRDFTYVDNAVSANLLACAREEAVGQVFNVGCGERTSLLDLVALLNEILGTQLEPEHHPGRAGDVRDSLADIQKARELLGYTPAVTLAEGVRKTVEWFSMNP